MDWGMRNRINRIIKPKTGKTVMLAVDHGYFQGPTTRLENPRKTITPLLPYADALMLTRGVLRTVIDAHRRIPIVLRVSGGTSILKEDLSDENTTVSIEDAIRLNASCLALSVFVGSAHEKQTLTNLAKLCDEGHKYGIPVLAVTAVGKEMARDARYLGLACRIAAELGAQIVKTYYCDEDFEKVTNGCPVPVVMAGGPKCETELEVFEFVYDGIQKGAIGVNLGRNVWQNPHPVAIMRALNAVIHDRASPKQAFDLFKSLQNT